MRKLTDIEIGQLEEQGCWAEDWTNVHVDDDFTSEPLRNVSFYGHVEIGSLNGTVEIEDGFRRRCCIKNVLLRDTVIGDNCLIENVKGYISNYQIGDNCYIADLGIMTAQEGSTCGGGTVISVLNEGGDGNVVLFEGLTAQIAWMMINFPAVKQLAKSTKTYDCGIVGAGSRIVGVKEISNVRIDEGCEVQGSSRLSNCTILSTDDASTLIGTDTIIENTIVAAGASIIDGAKVDNCFVGESVHVGKGFSAESSVFFANSYMDNGEACAALCGPFSTSHHKSTLLIGGAFSFYNAGSGTNQSNHAYKMGPIHWGFLDRGSKTASGSHILWPAHIGTFSMVMGKVKSHPQVHKLPFSYIIADEGNTWLVPGINIKTVGTWRDVKKWPKRDVRPLSARQDIINFAFPNPYIIQYVLEGLEVLKKLQSKYPKETEVYEYHGCLIKQSSLVKGIQYYELIINLFLYECFAHNQTETNDAIGGRWLDLMGMLAPKNEIDSVVRDIENGSIASISELQEILQQIHQSYCDSEQAYANFIMQSRGGNMFVDKDRWMQEAEQAHAQWVQMVKADAEREHQLGDVEDEQLRDFLTTIK